MDRSMIGACALVLALAGCETTGGPQGPAYANAQRPDCKAVVVTGQESLEMQNQRGTGGDEMRRTEGTLALGRLRMNAQRAQPRRTRQRHRRSGVPRLLLKPVLAGAPSGNVTVNSLLRRVRRFGPSHRRRGVAGGGAPRRAGL